MSDTQPVIALFNDAAVPEQSSSTAGRRKAPVLAGLGLLACAVACSVPLIAASGAIAAVAAVAAGWWWVALVPIAATVAAWMFARRRRRTGSACADSCSTDGACACRPH